MPRRVQATEGEDDLRFVQVFPCRCVISSGFFLFVYPDFLTFSFFFNGSKVAMNMLRCTILYTFLTFLCHWANAEQPVSYPIQWDNVAPNPPSPRNLASPYIGKCICDSTWGSCDPNCCCDIDCTLEEKKMFPFCLQETIGSPSIEYCYAQRQDKKVFQASQRYLDKVHRGKRAVCIVRANNIKDMDPFFILPKAISKPSDKLVDDWDGPKEANDYVVNGDLLLMKRIEVATAIHEMRTMGLFRIPSGRQDGSCTVEGRRVRFMNPIDSTVCVLSGAKVCALFPTNIYANLFLGAPGSSVSQNFTPIQLQFFDDVSGKLLAQVNATSSLPEVYRSVIIGNVCKNGVVRAQTLLVYNSTDIGLSLMNATTRLYLRDIDKETLASMLFQVEFSRLGGKTPASYFSGTPGYSEGARVRAGTLLEEKGKTAISERVSGFSIPSGDISCYKNKYRSVGFLYDVVSSGCTISLSELDLRHICAGKGTSEILRNILSIHVKHSSSFDGETKPINYVARTNDALANDTTSWVKIVGMNFSDIEPAPYDAVRRQCSNIYVGLRYTFVVSRVGAVFNPQDVIVAAFADPIIGSWRIRNKMDFSEAAVSTQRFRFLVTFRWTNAGLQKTGHRRVTAPPIFPPLDDTIFYPFSPPG
ncbi:Tectonic-1 [Trypanosoma rangeli]|uniref:Tectonic-1 n=1 Tax=Trypanosoma rangeli TaxID=5698 RepID=A0A3R7KNL3_TRYRA|nr:Tectonic-1 [Trypanosoma rangeli]RNE98197.1 Tectonic-1 [Trypanosoma rangeli]|eukprot:RNE98197.1 Tectonic-1 [Trypanosoma rangeli]